MPFPEIKIIVAAPAVVEWNGSPYYYSKRTGYYRSSAGTELHRDMWALAFGPIADGVQIHHKDENRTNNTLDNLEALTSEAHARHHNITKPRGFTVATPEQRSAGAKAMWNKRKPIKRVCLTCQGKYESRSTYSSFCSNKCKVAGRYRGLTGPQNVPGH